jgi:hypothetical protein
LAITERAGATSFVSLGQFGASGLARPLDKPRFDAVDPNGQYVYVTNANPSDGAYDVERFTLDGSPAPFTAGDTAGNVLGVPDQSDRPRVYRGTGASTYDCDDDAYGSWRCFANPQGIAVDATGNLYVADRDQPAVQVFDRTGAWVAQIGPTFDATSSSGTAHAEGFSGPTGLAVDSVHNLLFVADSSNYVYVFAIDGSASTYKGKLGTGESSASANALGDPQGLTTDGAGDLWVSDWYGARVARWSYTYAGGVFQATSPSPSGLWPVAGGAGGPEGIAYTSGDGGPTPAGVLVVDAAGQQVEQFDAGGTLLGQFGGRDDLPFVNPTGIAAVARFKSYGTALYVVDTDDNSVDVLVPGAPPAAQAPPTINGLPVEGQTLSASAGQWSNVSAATTYTYDWQRCDADGADCVSAQNGPASTYALTTGDVGATIVVGVTADNGIRSQEAFSAHTPVVTAAAQPGPVSSGSPGPTGSPAPTGSGGPAGHSTTASPTARQVKAASRVSSAPTTAPSTTVLSPKGQTVKIRTVAGAKVTLELILDGKTARRAGLGTGKKPVVVGRTIVKRVRASEQTVAVKAILTAKARLRLATLRRTFRLTLRTTFKLGKASYSVNRVETVNWAKPRRHRS